jgi:hypothetical protein
MESKESAGAFKARSLAGFFNDLVQTCGLSLLRDYVEMLLLTGIRHGTEAMGICWKHLEWHTD